MVAFGVDVIGTDAFGAGRFVGLVHPDGPWLVVRWLERIGQAQGSGSGQGTV